MSLRSSATNVSKENNNIPLSSRNVQLSRDYVVCIGGAYACVNSGVLSARELQYAVCEEC